MVINKSGSHIEQHADIFLEDGYEHYYISSVDLISISKYKYFSYMNCIRINSNWNIYYTEYWTEKDVE